ncbi:MAG: CPBP family intramembrane metalloprotease [Oscillospiraceae bacterium]|nr:CPBP family intramembrane metalloprotease [Oscillospiraceae bacterium]
MDSIKAYKKICIKIGLVMTIFFLSGIVCSAVLNAIEFENETTGYIALLAFSAVFLYFIPIIAATFILRNENQEKLPALYKKPPRLVKAIGNFPAVYGLGQLTNLIALLVAWLIAKSVQNINTAEQQETFERSFGTMNSIIPPNITCGIVLFIYMVFAAAIFEEFFCRGIILNALKPYGNGFAIIISGFLFGIMHGNFQQFFYAFVLGIVFAYITLQTGSILASTILHASFNSIAGIIMLFISTQTIQNYLFSKSQSVHEDSTMLLAVFGMFIALLFGLIITGIALAVRTITRIKVYKTDNLFTEISWRRKTLIFFTSVTGFAMMILAVDSFSGRVISSLILKAVFNET